MAIKFSEINGEPTFASMLAELERIQDPTLPVDEVEESLKRINAVFRRDAALLLPGMQAAARGSLEALLSSGALDALLSSGMPDTGMREATATDIHLTLPDKRPEQRHSREIDLLYDKISRLEARLATANAGPTSPDAAPDQAGDETIPGLIDKKSEDWYRWLLKCKTPFSNGDMSWDDIGRNFSVTGKTAYRKLGALQKRNLPGLDDWPKRLN